MSSHHFVKEGQEPALLIIDPLSLELIEPLLEWAPLVIVYDKALEEVLNWGIKIDAVIAKEDQVESITKLLSDQGPVKIIPYQSGENPVTACFNFLETNTQSAVNIIHENANEIFQIANQFISKLNVSVLTEQVRWSAVASRSFRKWFPAGTKLFVKGVKSVTVEQSETRSVESEVFVVLKDGMVTVEAETVFWVGENL